MAALAVMLQVAALAVMLQNENVHGPGPRPVASLELPCRPATKIRRGIRFMETELGPIEWTGKSFNYAAI